MAEQGKTINADEIRGLIDQVDGQLREAERLRNYVNDRSRGRAYFPERRRVPRVPQPSDDLSNGG